MILITSPNGKTGHALIKNLQKNNISYRLMTSSEKSKNELLNLGFKNIIIGNLLNFNDVDKAVSGTDAIYFITPNLSPDEDLIASNIISACSKIKNYKIVLHSVIHPQIKSLIHHWSRLGVEHKIILSGIPWVILQPTMYMQNILPQLIKIQDSFSISMPIPTSRELSMVDLDDVAEVAYKALVDNSFNYGIFELSGYSISLDMQARLISSYLGKKISAKQISIKEAKLNLKIPFKGKYGEQAFEKMFEYYSNYGLKSNSKILEFVLKRKPTNFSQFIKKYI
tara:strand:+ start:268 stop:1113 length:846 start_codon:yes stop_codon:yes gene_type:complete